MTLSDSTVAAAFARTAARRGAQPFLCVLPETARHYGIAPGETSYADLAARIDDLRQRYAAAGYGHGHRVGLLLENRPAFFLHWFALNGLGASVVPINADLRSAELEYLIGHSEIALAIAPAERHDALRAAARAAGRAMEVMGIDGESVAGLPAAASAEPRTESPASSSASAGLLAGAPAASFAALSVAPRAASSAVPAAGALAESFAASFTAPRTASSAASFTAPRTASSAASFTAPRTASSAASSAALLAESPAVPAAGALAKSFAASFTAPRTASFAAPSAEPYSVSSAALRSASPATLSAAPLNETPVAPSATPRTASSAALSTEPLAVSSTTPSVELLAASSAAPLAELFADVSSAPHTASSAALSAAPLAESSAAAPSAPRATSSTTPFAELSAASSTAPLAESSATSSAEPRTASPATPSAEPFGASSAASPTDILPAPARGSDSSDATSSATPPDHIPPAPFPAPLAAQPVDARTECALLYTSGTTGRPKGCILPNRYFLLAGAWYAHIGGLAALRPDEERMLTPLPLTHMNAMAYSTMAMVATGGCLIVLDRFHPSSWWDSVARSRATVVHYLGVMPAMLMKAAASAADRQHRVRFGFGAGVDRALHAPFEARFGFPLLEAWAMTETGAGAVVIANREPRQTGASCFGREAPEVDVRIVADDGQPAGAGEPGELLVRHAGEDPRDGFFAGYLKDDAATQEAWAGGWFHTGDIVRRGANEQLHFVDRRKNVIRRSGENISAVEVESVLLQHPRVKAAAVAAVPDALRGDEVLACIVAEDLPQSDDERRTLAESIVRECLARLAYYKAPGHVAFVEALPLTTSQKVQRAELRALAAARVGQPECFDLTAMKKRTA